MSIYNKPRAPISPTPHVNKTNLIILRSGVIRALQKHGPVLFKRQVPNGGYKHKTVATCPMAFTTAVFYGPVSFWRLKRQVPNGGYKSSIIMLNIRHCMMFHSKRHCIILNIRCCTILILNMRCCMMFHSKRCCVLCNVKCAVLYNIS